MLELNTQQTSQLSYDRDLNICVYMPYTQGQIEMVVNSNTNKSDMDSFSLR